MSFHELSLKLKKGAKPKKIIAIYGENGAGKSNIVSAFTNLALSLLTYANQQVITDSQAKLNTVSQISESGESDQQMNQLLKSILQATGSGTNILHVFKDAYAVDTNEPMIIKYNFLFQGAKGYYELVFKKTADDHIYLAKEELNYLINKTSGVLFSIKKETPEQQINTKFSPALMMKKNHGINHAKEMVEDLLTRFWGKHTFLALFTKIEDETNADFVTRNFSANFLKILGQLRSVAVKSDHVSGMVQRTKLLRNLTSGILTDTPKNRERILLTTQALNQYFVPLYGDILKMEYVLDITQDDLINYQLIELKKMAGKELKISFTRESHGTKQLLGLFPLFLNAVNGDVVVIDELDAGIHDLLVERLIESLKTDVTGQLIFTTHDTQLMGKIEPQSLYIIQIDSYGNKRVVNLSKSDISDHNNIEKLYLNGFFAGIPYAEDVDFGEILANLEENSRE